MNRVQPDRTAGHPKRRCVEKDAAHAAVQEEVPGRDPVGREDADVAALAVSPHEASQRSYIPGVGYIKVDAVDKVTLDALTDDDARLDGFPTAAALRTEFNKLYRDKSGGANQIYRVRFHVLGPAEQAAWRAEKEQRKRAAKTNQSSVRL